MNDLEREMAMLNGIDPNAQVAPVANATVVQPAPVQYMPEAQVPVAPAAPVQMAAPVQTVAPVVSAPVQQVPVAPVQPAVVQQVPVAPVAPVQTLDLSAAAKEAENMSTGEIEMGSKISSLPIEKLKGQLNERVRFSIISNKPIFVKSHYDETLGSFLCFEGECCKYSGEARTRYLFPIVVYPIVPNRPDQLLPASVDGKCTLKMLVVGNELYSTLSDLYLANGGTFEGYDIIATCTEAQYQKFTFQPTRDTFRTAAPDYASVASKWLSLKDKAYMVVARRMERDYYLQQKGVGTMPAEQVGVTNVPGLEATGIK